MEKAEKSELEKAKELIDADVKRRGEAVMEKYKTVLKEINEQGYAVVNVVRITGESSYAIDTKFIPIK